MKRLLITLLAAFALLPALAQDAVEDRVEELISRMTLDDKIGQLHQIDGRTDLGKVCDMIRKGQISSIMNIVRFIT